MTSGSLRLRLFAIILVPLLVMAASVGTWRIREAQKTAEDLFDRSLLSTAVAVARDVALSDGDAIRHETQRLLSETAGGPVRYHVYAPDGGFVTGYGVPPVPLERVEDRESPFVFFDAVNRGQPVRVLRMRDEARIAGLTGTFTVTLWQDQEVRQAFVRGLALRAFAVMAALIGTVAVVVWFGVNLGLRPLLALEEAIGRRSPEDLSPIRRRVPREAQRLVERLNHLFGQTRRAIESQQAFISDAAHQIRNPVAGLRALCESILTAETLPVARARAEEAAGAAAKVSELANRLLRLETLLAPGGARDERAFDLSEAVREVVEENAARAAGLGISLGMAEGGDLPAPVAGDPVMLREAVANLLDNSLLHGGPGLRRITVAVEPEDGGAAVVVADDGKGIAPAAFGKALARFGQIEPGQGSGLGLPIAEAVAARHGGRLRLEARDPGLAVRLSLPRPPAPPPGAA